MIGELTVMLMAIIDLLRLVQLVLQASRKPSNGCLSSAVPGYWLVIRMSETLTNCLTPWSMASPVLIRQRPRLHRT